MNKCSMPKWQRELQSFLGIKKGIILEGNIYDEYPGFVMQDGEAVFREIENLDHTIRNLATHDTDSVVIFCDPVDGLYCYEGNVERQKKILAPLLEGYSYRETLRGRQKQVMLAPVKIDDCGINQEENTKQTWISRIVRKTISDETRPGDGFRHAHIVLNFASRLDDSNGSREESNLMFWNLMAATTVECPMDDFCGSLILVVDKINDIPAWFYLNNPNIRTITIGAPDRTLRRLYLENAYGDLTPFSLLGREDYEPGVDFVAQTEGMQCQELGQILKLAYRMHIMPDEIHAAFRLYKYGIVDDPWDDLGEEILPRIRTEFEKIKGQERALAKVENIVERAVSGLSGLQHSSDSHKPRGIMFLAGPTGVGKTETAKALGRAIFGDENACIRFDMSEYREAHSDQKLFGAPPGYVGYEGGGRLTNEVRKRPFSVLLFDEIEKASPTILDKFLQILEDGRMTDNQGNTVYFRETVIIFTSNIGLTKVEYDGYGRPELDPSGEPKRVPTIMIEDPLVPDSDEFRQEVEQRLTEGVKSYFTNHGRPELLNRLGEDNIVVFQFINKDAAEQICEAKLKTICADIKSQKGLLVLYDGVLDLLKRKAIKERANGGRGVGNMLEREFLNPLATQLGKLSRSCKVLRCHADAQEKIRFEVMDDADQDGDSR